MTQTPYQEHRCPVCGEHAEAYDVVDFNKNCVEERGVILPLAQVPIYYFLCGGCGFLFAPAFSSWSREDFSNNIYNEDYIKFDPDFDGHRSSTNGVGLLKMFPANPAIRHLDYGGGSGHLTRMLVEGGWDSRSYDPYASHGDRLEPGEKYNLITSFEVFEHVVDPVALVQELHDILDDEGILMFSTLLSDGFIQRPQRINWWYVSPRNGHISIYSERSLRHLAQRFGFRYKNPLAGLHFFWKRLPGWAEHLRRGLE